MTFEQAHGSYILGLSTSEQNFIDNVVSSEHDPLILRLFFVPGRRPFPASSQRTGESPKPCTRLIKRSGQSRHFQVEQAGSNFLHLLKSFAKAFDLSKIIFLTGARLKTWEREVGFSHYLEASRKQPYGLEPHIILFRPPKRTTISTSSYPAAEKFEGHDI